MGVFTDARFPDTEKSREALRSERSCSDSYFELPNHWKLEPTVFEDVTPEARLPELGDLVRSLHRLCV